MSAVITPTAGTQAIYRVNPVAKLVAAFIIAFALVPSIDWVSGAVALGCECVLVIWAGLGPRRLLLRTLPVWIAAPLGGLTMLLYGDPSGRTHAEFLAIHITDGSIELAIATVLRVLAIALPAVVLFVTVDPTRFADSLAQLLRLPSRFVLGALAALRLVALLLDDWRSLEQARRARGIADRGRVRRFPGQVFAILVLAIRRGGRLATAMEARAFGAPVARSWARPSRLGWPDLALVLIALGVAVLAVGVSVAVGAWNPIFGR